MFKYTRHLSYLAVAVLKDVSAKAANIKVVPVLLIELSLSRIFIPFDKKSIRWAVSDASVVAALSP
jgi:hypothetical protein